MMKLKKKPFQMPQQVLRTVHEMTNGGFVLFAFDENGIPEPFASFDSVTHSLAMITYISNWVNAVTATNLEMTKNSMLMSQRKR